MKAQSKKDLAKALNALEASRAKLEDVQNELKAAIPVAQLINEVGMIKTAIEEQKPAFQNVLDENAEWFDSLSEKRQEEEADEYDEAAEALESAVGTLDEIMESLDMLKETLEPVLPKKKE